MDEFDKALAAVSAPAPEAGGDDDAFAAALAQYSTPAPTPVAPEPEAEAAGEEPPVMDAAAAFLAAQGLGGGEPAAAKKKKKKPAKKKGGGGEDGEDKPAGKTKAPSAMAAKIMAQKAAQEAEEARIAEETREQEEAIAAAEAAEKAAEEAAETKRAEKKKRQEDNVAAQKAAGTFLTKAQKKKKAEQEAALARMAAAGMVPTAGQAGEGGPKKKVVYDNKKKKQVKKSADQEAEELIAAKAAREAEAEAEAARAAAAAAAAESSGDDWDAGSDSDIDLGNLVIKDIIQAGDEEEDETVAQLAVDKKKMIVQQKARVTAKAEADARYDSEDSDYEGMTKEEIEAEVKMEESRERREQLHEEALARRSADKLRSPICVIMGHVDTGKTKLLDNIRRTNVQDQEAGGITQQIGATFFPLENVKKRCFELNKSVKLKYELPGMLVIDTPGHESFSNLRNRGSSLCDIAILVIDITHGLEPQTIESLKMLQKKKAPFIVALNKVDRCYGWKECINAPIQSALAKQDEHVVREFKDRAAHCMLQLNEQGLNAKLYWENEDLENTISCVPTSAITGEGVCDILLLINKITQERMRHKLMFCETLQCTVLEVKVMDGLGTTVDCVLVNGELKEGDQICVCTLEGPVVTQVRALLTPHPMKEIRVKGEYLKHATLEAAIGVKICAHNLEKAIAGTSIVKVMPEDDVEDIKQEVMKDIEDVFNKISTSSRGVYVVASTLGSLEALLDFLKNGCGDKGETGREGGSTSGGGIPVAAVSLGPVHKKDVIKAAIQLEHDKKYACILAFDVPITAEAATMAKETGVQVFQADIIYHLFDQFSRYLATLAEDARENAKFQAVFPCKLDIMPNCIFNKKDPIVLGVEVKAGILKVGTKLCCPSRLDDDGKPLIVGTVAGIEQDHKSTDLVKPGKSVAVNINPAANLMYGRQFDHKDQLVSHLTRESIDALKTHFRNDLGKEDWKLVIQLKKLYGII
jgi:translation initiation factor 5B